MTVTALQSDLQSKYLLVTIDGQSFGLPVDQVREVFAMRSSTKVPLAPPGIAGALNLRGRIVVAIDVRAVLDLGPFEGGNSMAIVVDWKGEPHCLIVDAVQDVCLVTDEQRYACPANLEPTWQAITQSLMRLEESVFLVLDIPRLFAALGEGA